MIIDSSIKLDSIPLQHQNIKQRHLLASTRVHRTPRVQRHTKHIFLEAKKLFFLGRTEFCTLNRSRKQCNFYFGSLTRVKSGIYHYVTLVVCRVVFEFSFNPSDLQLDFDVWVRQTRLVSRKQVTARDDFNQNLLIFFRDIRGQFLYLKPNQEVLHKKDVFQLGK